MTIPSLDQYLALDCEMVQCHKSHALAKVGIVDHAGNIVLETFVHIHPTNVADWRSESSGIKPGDLDNAPKFSQVVAQVKRIVQGKIIVGHTVFNDLAILTHRHPYEQVRDTALYYPLRQRMGIIHEGQYPSLRKLAKCILGTEIQNSSTGHDPIEDAKATMAIFLTVREEYENSLLQNEDCISGIPSSFSKWYW